MLSLTELLQRHCRPLSGAPMTPAAVDAQLVALPEWKRVGDALAREYRFANYYETLAFVNALAYVVHREDHHPDLVVAYDRCEVRFSTHSVGGISENDFVCAAKADAIFARQFGTSAA